MATKDISPHNPTPPGIDPMIDPVTGEQRVIAPGHTFRSVTEKLTRIVLTPHTPLGWFFGFAIAGSFAMHVAGGGDLAVPERYGHLGHHHPGGLGICHHQLCLVDRNRPRRNTDFRHPFVVQAEAGATPSTVLRKR